MTNRSEVLRDMGKKIAKCKRCKELVEFRVQTVLGRGNPEADIVLVGEAPGRDENREGLPFVGRAGKLLDNILTSGGLDPEKDVYIMNVLKCWPPENRNPKPEEIENCRPIFDLQLEVLDPKFVVCLGKYAAQNFLGEIDSLGSMRGKAHEVNNFIRGHAFKVVVWYHPAYLLRNPKAKEKTWEDLQFLLSLKK